MLTGSLSNDWHNIYHATISANNDGYGSRIPGIWIRRNNGAMNILVWFAINGTNKYYIDVPTTPIQLNKWITIIVSQTKVGGEYHFKYEMNGNVLYTKKNAKPQQFENVKIYISDPWYSPVPGNIRNVYIKGKV